MFGKNKERIFKDGIIKGVNCPYEEVWQGRLFEYDDAEVHGVVNLNAYSKYDTDGTYCMIDDEADPPHFYSAYARLKSGEFECIGDFTKHSDAVEYADMFKSLIRDNAAA